MTGIQRFDRLRRIPGWALFGLAVCGLFVSTAGAQTDQEMTWTAEDCAACHAEVVEHFDRGPHAELDKNPDRLPEGVYLSCSGCHTGNVDAHIESGGEEGLMSFGEGTPAIAKIQGCTNCHGSTHPRFQATAHARAGLDCASCHSVHQTSPNWSLLKSGESAALNARSIRDDELSLSSATCYECHQDVFTEFEFNERHRLQEGILDCTSCHNPHEPQRRAHLAGFKQESCIDCHTDKGGPFVFEHASSIVDGCVSCHTPHGSPNRHMLTFQSTAELCYSCHAEVPQFHFGFNPTAPPRFGLDTQCTNCHSSIHGSNFDPAFLK